MGGNFCFYSTCKVNSRKNPEAVFLPFVKHKTDYLRCKRWIHLCGRKETHNPEKINKEIKICTEHFPPYVNHDWKKNPDLEPYPVGYKIKPRKPPIKRQFVPIDLNESGPNLAEKSQKTYCDGANSKIILQQSIEKIQKFLFNLEDQNMKPADMSTAEIYDVIQNLSEIEDSLGETKIKEVYMCPPELFHKKFVKPKVSKEPVNLNENTNFNLVETQAMELEVEGKSFIIKSSIEPGNHNAETEENSENLNNNPWKVCNLQEFLRFHCPACGFLSQDLNDFYSHAIENHEKAKEIWSKGVLSEQKNENCEANNYQEAKLLLEEEFISESDSESDIEIEPSMDMVEVTDYEKAKKLLEKTFNTKNIDVPTIVQVRDNTKGMDIDFDSLEVENTETLQGYDDFRDNFDRYSIDANLDSSQSIKNNLDMPEKRNIEWKLISDLPLRKVNHISEMKSDDNFEEFKQRNTQKYIIKICDQTKEFLCPIEGCKVKYKTIHLLQNHIRNHPKPKVKVPKEIPKMITVQCEHCGWKAGAPCSKIANVRDQNIKLEKHLFYHHNSNHVSDSICDVCEKKFFDILDLEKHKLVYHGDEKVCETCGKSFKTSFELNNHRNRVHNERKWIKCEICDKQFKGGGKLKVHKERAHQDESLRTCHICHKVLHNRCELYKHYMNDHSIDENPVQIDGKYVFQCEYCMKILGSLPATYTHIKLVHKMKTTTSEIKVTKKQKCSFCIEENLSSKDYVIHLVNEHPDKEPPNDLKNLERGFNCSDCDEIYLSPMFYYRHLKYNHEKIEHDFLSKKAHRG